MTLINTNISISQRMLIRKINKLINSGGMHGWWVVAVVYQHGLCCIFG